MTVVEQALQIALEHQNAKIEALKDALRKQIESKS